MLNLFELIPRHWVRWPPDPPFRAAGFVDLYLSGDSMLTDQQILLLAYLARQILLTRAGKVGRAAFYEQFSRHQPEPVVCVLKRLVAVQYRDFLGWCALTGRIASYSVFADYVAANPHPVTDYQESLTVDADPQLPLPVRPWYADLPHLATREGGQP